MINNPRQYLIPAEAGGRLASILAALVHLVLLAFLWFGLSWETTVQPDATVIAEIWSPLTLEAAPPPPSPIIRPQPEPPKPVAAVTPPAPTAEPEPAQRKEAEPDIALEKEKNRKQQKEDAERIKKEKLAEKKALEEEQKRKKIADAEEKLQEKKQQDELEKIKRAEEKKQKEEALAEEQKKLAEDQRRKQEEAATAEQRARRNREDIQRLKQSAGDGLAGDAEKSQGVRGDNSYSFTIRALILKNTIKIPNLADIVGNPTVEFRIELYPDGRLREEPKRVKSSGVEAFDQTVKRAIEKSAPFPPDPSTEKVPANMTITHRPKDSVTR